MLYMSEVAPKKFRGAIVAGYQFCIIRGPQLRALGTLRGQPYESQYVKDELNELVANHEYEMRNGQAGWADCFRGRWTPSRNLRRVVLGMALQMMQQWTGVNFNCRPTERFPHLDDHYRCQRLLYPHLLLDGAVGMLVCEFIIAIVGTANEGSKATGICLIDYGNMKTKIFFLSGATCTACVLFAYFLVDRMLEDTTPRHSSKWVLHSMREDMADISSLGSTEKAVSNAPAPVFRENRDA
ncbi:hypothetical protein EJ02DRAFT_448882 [Clathrospora elynae]|uniref:Uncharacterized protein n=1 Tax=Clathrospora elynae TaxID=706981 RepID=A0A6A5S5B9_9PLEO|nr:hypothetical protein EJ02DRAFT_448882 [Clathrospora elynae]